MPKHNQRLISILLFISIIGYANYTNADDCFSKEETESVLTELKNEWWTPKEQSNLVINFHSSHLIQNNNKQECVVLIESRDKKFDCHGCGAYLGIAIYTKDGNLWEKKFEQKGEAEIGSWGKLPEVKMVRIGEDNFGIMFHEKHMSQGHYSEGYNLIAIVEGKFKEVIQIPTHSNNRGFAEGMNIEPYEWNAQYELIEGDNKEYFDIQLVQRGTESVGTNESYNVIPVNETKIYKFSKGKYELVN